MSRSKAMKLPDIFKKKTENRYKDNIIALDVGTEFVKVVVYDLNGGKVNVLGYKKVRQQPDAMKGAMIVNMRNVIENCNVAISELVRELGITKPTQMVLGIAGELVQGITILANMERSNPSDSIEKEEIEKIIGKVRKKAFENAVVDVSSKTGIEMDQIEEIDTVINDTYIDGFRVGDPYGFQGREIKFKIFSTFAPSIHANSLKSLALALGFELLNIIAEPYAITRSIHGGRDDNYGAIIIDIGGGTTDVAVVSRGGIVGTQMYSYGGRVFTRRISYDLNIDYQTAESMKLKYSRKELEEPKHSQIQKAIAKDMPVWIDGLELALSEFEDIEVFPGEILLCGGGSLLPEIKESILSYPWTKTLPFNRFPKVSFLLPENLEGINDTSGISKGPSDIAPLALARYTLDTFLQENS